MQVNEPLIDPVGRIDPVRVNVVGGVAAAVFVGGYFALVDLLAWGHPLRDFSMAAVLGWFVVGVLLHEVLHGIGFRVGGIPWSNIRFGVMWASMVPFAGCTEPMEVERYEFALLLPGGVSGVLPWFLGAAYGNHVVAVSGALLTAAAAGDFLVWLKARRLPRGTVIYDLSSEVGFGVVGGSPQNWTPSLPR